MTTMYPLSLSDWDCWLIKNAVLAHVSLEHLAAQQNNSKFNKHILKAYIDASHLRHNVNWSNTTRKSILNYVSNLSSYNRIHNLGLNADYNPHDYRVLLSKLRTSVNS